MTTFLVPPSFEAIVRRPIEAIIIGASAGGVEAMLSIFSALPAKYPLPIIALLHMPEDRESNLVNVFQHMLSIRVKEADDKEAIQPGIVYFASSGYHMLIEKDHSFSFSCEPPVNYSRPAIDVLMESAAEAYGEKIMACLLTGANYDGTNGLKSIQAAGGLTVVQDPAEAAVAIMPQQAIKNLIPDFVLNLEEIKSMLLSLGRSYAA